MTKRFTKITEKKNFFHIILSSAITLSSAAGIQAQTYAPYVTNPFNLVGLGGMVKPVFVDLDNDSDLDLITATNTGQNGAEIIYYENLGTNIAPNYGAAQPNLFGFPYIGGIISPTFVDLDADGDMDLMCGVQGGTSYYFENIGTPASPIFEAPVTNPFGLYGVGYLSSHTFADIDNDGDQDVLIGEYYGSLFYFQNIGTATAPAFGPDTNFPFGLSNVGNAPKPIFLDMDKDGDQDILVGVENGNQFYFQNTGTLSAPSFAAAVQNPFGLSAMPQIYNALTAGDIDGDGDLDILAADNSNVFKYFQNTTPLPIPSIPINTTSLDGLFICNNTPATLTAKGIPIGSLGWYDAPSGGNYLGGGSPFNTPSLVTNTTFYVQDSTTAGASTARKAITVNVAAAISSSTITAGQSEFCVSGSLDITLTSEVGIDYYLHNQTNNTDEAVLAGTGNVMTFGIGGIQSTMTYNIVAEKTFTSGATSITCTLISIPSITITIKQPVTASISTNICYGDNYTYADGTVATNIGANQSHVSTLTAQAANGCDSTLTENLISLPALTSSISTTICAEESISINGTLYNAANPIGTEIFTAVNGCDSTVSVNLNVLPILASSVTNTMCSDQSISINGTLYNATNPSGSEIFTAINGCDSTVTVNLNILTALTSSITTAICAEESITINGTEYNAANLSGTEVFINVGMYGCDSTVTILLTLNPTVDVTTTTINNVITANLAGATYQWINCMTDAPIAEATTQNFTPTENGNYAVIITTTTCSDTSDCVNIFNMAIQEFGKNILFNIYPNPSNGVFTLDVNEPVAIRISNIAGQIVSTQKLIAGKSTIHLEHLDNGIYFISAMSANKRNEVLRVVIAK